jgi:hypothetical protein
MKKDKSLYFLHIPKTGGTSVNDQIIGQLFTNNIKKYPPGSPPHSYSFSGYQYITGHFARYPVDMVENLDVACLFRDPLDRSISTFLYIYNLSLFASKEYCAIPNFVDKLKYFLFYDTEYFFHQNIQSKFISNSINIKNVKNKYGEDFWYKVKDKGWGIKNTQITYEIAKQNLDKIAIVGTTKNHKKFIKDIADWFLLNHDIKIYQTDKLSNRSSVIYNNVEYNTPILRELLSIDDYKMFFDKNIIDYQIYNYINNKDGGKI